MELKDHTGNAARAKRNVYITLFILAVTLVASFFAPTPHNNDPIAFHTYLAVVLGATISFVSAALMFVSRLEAFTDKLKRSYRLFCIALILLGLAFVQLPIMLYLVDISTYWRDSSATAYLFLLSIIMVYASARSLARLFGVKNITTSIWFAVVGTISFAAIMVLTPHTPTVTPEIKFNAAIGANSLSVFNMVMAAILIYQAKRRAGVMFTNGFAWVIVSYLVMASAGLLQILSTKILGDQQWFLIGTLPLVPLFIAGLIMLRAAYSFNAITVAASDTQGWVPRNFFGNPVQSVKASATTSVDVVVYAANLASNPSAIDSAREKMRMITAHIQEGTPISPADEASLKDLYLEIEQYLVGQEPIRKFTRESLRRGIAEQLGLNDKTANGTFWPQLTS